MWLCKTSVSVRQLLSVRSAYEQLRVILQTTDDLINSATKAALDGASIAAAVLNDRIVSCRLTRLVRPISAFAFKRRVASAITETSQVSHWTRMLLSSLSLFLSIKLLDFNYQLRKNIPTRERWERLRPMNFTAPRDKCTETRIPPSSVSAVNGGSEIYSVQEYSL